MHPNLFLVQVPDQFDALFNPKNASEKNIKNITRPSIGKKTYEFSRHRCCLALNVRDTGNHLYSHRFKPQTEPCVPKHERRKVVTRVRGCKMTKIQE